MNFKQMDVWKHSRYLCNEIFLILKEVKSNDFDHLKKHMFRTSISVISNIAEGLGRETDKEKIRFLIIARGSLYELESQVIILKDLNIQFGKLSSGVFKRIQETEKLINGTIRFLKK